MRTVLRRFFGPPKTVQVFREISVLYLGSAFLASSIGFWIPGWIHYLFWGLAALNLLHWWHWRRIARDFKVVIHFQGEAMATEFGMRGGGGGGGSGGNGTVEVADSLEEIDWGDDD